MLSTGIEEPRTHRYLDCYNETGEGHKFLVPESIMMIMMV
jgi:hypothetical protein